MEDENGVESIYDDEILGALPTDDEDDVGVDGTEQITDDNPDEDSLNDFWTDPEDEGQDNEDGESDDESPQEAMRQMLEAGIAEFNIPEELIPEDFNAGDPRQLRELLANTQRTAIQHSLKLMFAPVQQALVDMQKTTDARIAEAVERGITGNNQRSLLESQIPLANDPESGPFVKMAYERALKNNKGDAKKAIAQTRKVLMSAGMQPDGRKMTRSNRQGASGLDVVAPLPKQSATSRTIRKRLAR